jgi:hypothetical protein
MDDVVGRASVGASGRNAEKLGIHQCVEHESAHTRVHATQSLHLRRSQLKARFLDVLRVDAF